MESVSPHVYASWVPSETLPPYDATRCYWVGDDHVVLLVDCGDGQEAGRAVLEADWRELGSPAVMGIVVTHYHPDHSGGAMWARRRWAAPVYLHPRDQSRLALADAGSWADPPQSWTVAGMRVECLPAPGHTPGQVNLWISAERVLLAGDNVLGNSTVVIRPPDGDLGQYLATLVRLRALKPAVIGPGHGDVVRDAEAYLAYYLQHRAERQRQILALLEEEPKTAEELAQAIYAHLLAPADRYLGVWMVQGHLAWCESNGLVARDGHGYRKVKDS
ncbi:MAG: MBL fold metallo-hydrolase [Firmicutes bacterium]|nr:MBL fold metallo-hydrolase [Bacillota bacterium]